nr:hypothetical protein [Tanacetum cinerariifolium]
TLVDLYDPKRSDDDTKVIFNEEQFLRQQSTAQVTPPALAYTPPPPCLATMEPLDDLLMGDEVISTNPAKENEEFINSSVDDLVLILREFEVTLQQQFDYCEVYGGPHYSSDCQTRSPLVYEPNPGNNCDISYLDQPSQFTPPQPLPLSEFNRTELIKL